MRTRCTELAQLVEAAAQQIVGALHAGCDEGLSVRQLTELLGVALRQRSQIEAAVTRTIGAGFGPQSVGPAGAAADAGMMERAFDGEVQVPAPGRPPGEARGAPPAAGGGT